MPGALIPQQQLQKFVSWILVRREQVQSKDPQPGLYLPLIYSRLLLSLEVNDFTSPTAPSAGSLILGRLYN
jgi:hypothetical protein